MHARDLDSADRILRLAFGTIRGLPDPTTAFGDSDPVRTRFRAAPDAAWVAEIDGEVVGSVFATRWGSFGFFGPLSVRPDLWDRGIGSRLLEPVLDAFAAWDVLQAGLFTFAESPKHLGLYRKHGFSPGPLTVITSKESAPVGKQSHALFSQESVAGVGPILDEIRGLTDRVFSGLDVGREVVAVHEQGIGDTVLVRREGTLDSVAVCHCGAGSEAGGDTCYVKFGAVRRGEGAAVRFERLLDACDAFASGLGLGRLVAGVNLGRLDAYRRLLARGFREDRVGASMWLRPEEPSFATPADYVIDDLR